VGDALRAYWSVVFTFECMDPETWTDQSLAPFAGSSHAVARAPAAMDAVCLMYTTTKYTKEAMFPHTGTWTLNEFIMVAGQCTSDNLPPRLSQIQYSWRSPTLGIQEQIYRVLERNAKHVAETTGCRLSVRWITKTRIGLPNNAMAEVTYRNMALVGAPVFDEEARRFGREMQKNLGLTPMDDPFLESCQRLLTPQEHEANLRRGLPPWQVNFTSDDYVDYTWHAPTVRLHTARLALRPPSPSYTYPMWTRNALGGIPSAIDPGIFVAGKTIGATLVDLLTRPEDLARATAEFNERTGEASGAASGWPHCFRATSSRRSISDGRSTSRRRVARSGGFPRRIPRWAEREMNMRRHVTRWVSVAIGVAVLVGCCRDGPRPRRPARS